MLAVLTLPFTHIGSLSANSITVSGEKTAPTMTATSLDGAILMEWEPVENAQKYRYRYRRGAQAWSTNVQLSNSTLMYLIEELENGAEYTVAVGTRVNDKWLNDWAEATLTPGAEGEDGDNEDSDDPTEDENPGDPDEQDQPSNDYSVTVEGNGTAPTATATPLNGAIYLDWEPVENAQKYRYRYREAGGSWTQYSQLNNETFSVIIGGLTNETTYDISLSTRANNKWRNEATILTVTPSIIHGNPDIDSDFEYRNYAPELGLTSIPESSSSFGKPCVADLNADGKRDVLWSEHKADVINLFWGQESGTFVLDSGNSGLVKHDNHGCAVADFDKDGDLDIFGPNGACQGTCFKNDRLWLQDEHGKFEQLNHLMGDMTRDRSREVALLDVNNDGWTDILVSATASSTGNTSFHRIIVNLGNDEFGKWRGFQDTDMGLRNARGNASCAEATDIDNDGWTDIIICDADSAWIYKNIQGQVFVDYPFPGDLSLVHGASFSDVNNDGWEDLLLAKKNSLQVWLNSSGSFNIAFEQPLEFGWEVVTPDIDGDGDKDIFVVQALSNKNPESNSAHMLFLNNGDATGWTRKLVPQPWRGAGDKAVVMTNFMSSGKDAVLVGNGGQWDTKGPRQVIASTNL